MSRGKYSLAYQDEPLGYNSKGSTPVTYERDNKDPEHYALTCTSFDIDGFDSYGYSCYDKSGKYLGDGRGIDRAGWTEDDYLTLQDIPEEHRDSYYFYRT